MCVMIHKKLVLITRIVLVAQDIIIILFQTLHVCIVEKLGLDWHSNSESSIYLHLKVILQTCF
jgi:hypothetical protein